MNLYQTTKNLQLRLAQVSDAEFILSLRLDASKNQYLSAVTNDLQAQRDWLAKYKVREQARQEYYFIIESHALEPLGVVRLYDFQGDSFCWGSWILKPGAPALAAIESALAVYETAFYALGFQRSHFEVRKGNSKVMDFHLRFGAVVVHEDDLEHHFCFEKLTYERTRLRYQRFLQATTGTASTASTQAKITSAAGPDCSSSY
jgi:RimJ/RimL family protein N-acetyltransferase